MKMDTTDFVVVEEYSRKLSRKKEGACPITAEDAGKISAKAIRMPHCAQTESERATMRHMGKLGRLMRLEHELCGEEEW